MAPFLISGVHVSSWWTPRVQANSRSWALVCHPQSATEWQRCVRSKAAWAGEKYVQQRLTVAGS